MSRTILTLLFICFFASFSEGSNHNPQTEQLLLAGSGSNIPPLKPLISAFRRKHPEVNFVPPENIGSSGAIRAAADGAIPVGLISRPLSPEEQKLPLIIVPYAKTAVVVAVHPSVADTNISHQSLNAVYAGRKTTWKNGQPIIVLSREPDESTILLIADKISGFRELYRKAHKEKRWPVLMKDEVMSSAIQETPGAIGFSDIGAIISNGYRIKALSLNGVAPTKEAVVSGNYPLVKQLSFVYRKDRITPEARQFIQFVLSQEGQQILSKQGYVPLQER